MTRIRVPSSSADSTAFGSTAHDQPTPPVQQKKVTRKKAKRDRPKTAKARAAANAAYKKSQKQRNPHRQFTWSYVFVGNIAANVDDAALKDHFRNCGTVISANIRCSGGIATTVKPDPNYYRNHKVRQYGVVTFATEKAVSNAMLLNGSRLGDSEITVCRSAGDLPEVKEKIQERLDDYRARNGIANVSQARRSAVRSLKIEPTVLIDVDRRKKPSKLTLFGFSFPMNIMG